MNRAFPRLLLPPLILLLWLAACSSASPDSTATGTAGTDELFTLPTPIRTTAFSATREPTTTATASVRAGDETETGRRYANAAPTPATMSRNVAATMGDPNAPVRLVEFTDYQCPFCARYSQETMPSLIETFIDTGIVYYELKDLPLDIHDRATIAAEAARCAGEQDAYWEMHDALFAAQSAWSSAPDAAGALSGLATDLKLDTVAFDDCLGSGRHTSHVLDNLNEALALGIQGTPSFYLDGYPISGAQPFELFEFAIGLAQEGVLADAYRQPLPSAGDGAYALGNPDAPVVIVEFTDYQCPFCARYAAETLPQLIEAYVETGQVYYVFKDFPLTNSHPLAVRAAEAARCAGNQDAYLEMHDLLFARQREWSQASEAAPMFSGYAAELRLDTASFDQCLADKRYEERVLANLEEGAELGVSGTPSFFINNEVVSGAQPYSVFEQIIDTQLAAE